MDKWEKLKRWSVDPRGIYPRPKNYNGFNDSECKHPYKTLNRILRYRENTGFIKQFFLTKKENEELRALLQTLAFGRGQMLFDCKSRDSGLSAAQDVQIEIYANSLERNGVLPLNKFESFYYSLFPGQFIKKLEKIKRNKTKKSA